MLVRVKSVSFHPAARRELLRAAAWYRERSETAAVGFDAEINHAVARIQEGPERYAVTKTNRRRFVLIKYPYAIVYRIRENEIEIIAVAHHRRRPEYWKNR